MSTTPQTAAVPQQALRDLLDRQRTYAAERALPTVRQRKRTLRRLADYLDRPEQKDRLIAALHQDLRKHEVETISSELAIVLSHIRTVRAKLGRWAEPERVATPLSQTGMRNYVYKEPKGNVLIIAPWNYPLNLTLVPLVYALAAGCTAVVKPSEMTPATTAFMSEMIEELFDAREVYVVQGDGATAAFLTTLPFDHIYFTGSPAIGKKVMAAAAPNLTSVTLELGGKSPAVIDETVNLRKSAENTVWGKCFNAGQTCVAPDYLVVHESIAAEYVAALGAAITRFYGENPQTSPDLARIVNQRHTDRLAGLLEDAVRRGATVAHGGTVNRAERYVAPTVLTGVTEEMKIMEEEIFGPLLPVLTYRTLNEAIAIINRRPKALALYAQTNEQQTVCRLLAGTSSGSAMVNEYILVAGNPALPFGGVNNSGIGKGGGYHGFVEFTNERAVMERKFLDLAMVYPPYTDRVKMIVNKIYRWL